MQPNLPQDAKFSPGNRDAIMRRYLALSDRDLGDDGRGVADVTHLSGRNPPFRSCSTATRRALAQIAALLPPGTTLSPARPAWTTRCRAKRSARFFNAIQVVGDDGAILGTYDKVHLVPFGEYLPAFLDAPAPRRRPAPVRPHAGRLRAGERRTALAVPGLPPVAATICYEAIFPGAVLPAGPRPGLILNVTNDAWFGHDAGSPPAFRPGAAAGRRGRACPRARRQYRHLRGGRPLWPDRRQPAARASKACSMQLCRPRSAHLFRRYLAVSV